MEQFDELFYISRLISCYLKEELTVSEQKDLDDWLMQSPENEAMFRRLTDRAKLEADLSVYGHTNKRTAWARIEKETGYRRSGRLVLLKRVAAAAVIITVSITIWTLLYQRSAVQPVNHQLADVAPGGNKAILTLANGEKVDLSNSKEGELVKEAGLKITRTRTGEIIYTAVPDNSADLKYNTITTPKGGQWHLLLADGTEVWLNAASSLRYPVSFNNNTREVELTGEAYFEVAQNDKQAFIVKTGRQEVDVLGTHFNINAYEDEAAVTTTLIEGAIRVRAKNDARHRGILKPGEQAILSDQRFMISTADVESAIAWKNGLFSFNNASITTVMNQISRWYDVDVKYEGEVPDREFSGNIYRSSSLLQTLEVLSYSKIHYKIENKTIIVTN